MTIHSIPTEDLVAELRRRSEVISAALEAADPVTPQVRRVLLAVADAFACPVSRLFRRDRTERVTVPRQAAMVLLRDHVGLAFSDIGGLFGQHHATAIHALNTQPGRMLDPAYASRFRAASAALAAEIAAEASPPATPAS